MGRQEGLGIHPYTIVYEYLDETRGLEVGKVAVQLVKSLYKGKDFDLDSALNIVKEKFVETS